MLNGDEHGDPSPFACAVEVDGICLTLDMFMKQQEATNQKLQAGIDKILNALNNPPVLPEDKGSNIKGKNIQSPSVHQFHSRVPAKQIATAPGNHWDTNKMFIPQSSTQAMQNTPPEPHTAFPHNNQYHYNDSTNGQHYGKVYYFQEHFDPALDWQQHPWNVEEDEEQLFTNQTLPTQNHHREIHRPNSIAQTYGHPNHNQPPPYNMHL